MRRPVLLTAPTVLALLVLVGCGGDGTTAAPEAGSETVAPGTAGAEAATLSPPTAEPTEIATSLAPGERCVSPLGYSFALPTGWQTNAGDVAPACAYLDPGTFTVAEGSEERPAAIAVYVDQVPFAEATAERPGEVSREQATLAAREAVRVEVEETADSPYPEGTRRTVWFLDLPVAPGDDEPRTLVADVVDVPDADVDYEEAATVLDRLMVSLQLEAAADAVP